MEEKLTKRIYSFDFLRILAVCAVVMIHISADYIKAFDNSSAAFVWGNLFSCLSRFAVPVFLMISGALMLDEEKHLPPKRIMKATFSILMLIIAWSLIYTIGYNVIRPIAFNEPLSVSDILSTLFNGHYHMWYLYVLVGLYLITPLLRFFVKKENAGLIGNYLIFSVLICFVFSFLNEFITGHLGKEDILAGFLMNFDFKYMYEYLIYYVLGWYIANVEFKKVTRIIIYIGGIAGLLSTFVGTHFHYGNERGNYFVSNNSLNVFLYSLAIFVFVYYLFKNRNIVLSKFWLKTSKLTFGVYIVHCIFLFVLKLICNVISSVLLQILTVFIGCIALSFVSVFIMSKLPLIKKLIRE